MALWRVIAYPELHVWRVRVLSVSNISSRILSRRAHKILTWWYCIVLTSIAPARSRRLVLRQRIQPGVLASFVSRCFRQKFCRAHHLVPLVSIGRRRALTFRWWITDPAALSTHCSRASCSATRCLACRISSCHTGSVSSGRLNRGHCCNSSFEQLRLQAQRVGHCLKRVGR